MSSTHYHSDDEEDTRRYHHRQQHHHQHSDDDDDDMTSDSDNDDSGLDKKRVRWTSEEDEILRKVVRQLEGKNWKKIAEVAFKSRKTDVQCLHRWQKVLDPKLHKGPWTREEDEKVIELVRIHGAKKWSAIAQQLPGRIGKQCRERWHNHLNPNICKKPWMKAEDRIIVMLYRQIGRKWAEMSKYLQSLGYHRTDNSIKNHWNSSLKKKFENDPNAQVSDDEHEEEDESQASSSSNASGSTATGASSHHHRSGLQSGVSASGTSGMAIGSNTGVNTAGTISGSNTGELSHSGRSSRTISQVQARAQQQSRTQLNSDMSSQSRPGQQYSNATAGSSTDVTNIASGNAVATSNTGFGLGLDATPTTRETLRRRPVRAASMRVQERAARSQRGSRSHRNNSDESDDDSQFDEDDEDEEDEEEEQEGEEQGEVPDYDGHQLHHNHHYNDLEDGVDQNGSSITYFANSTHRLGRRPPTAQHLQHPAPVSEFGQFATQPAIAFPVDVDAVGLPSSSPSTSSSGATTATAMSSTVDGSKAPNEIEIRVPTQSLTGHHSTNVIGSPLRKSTFGSTLAGLGSTPASKITSNLAAIASPTNLPQAYVEAVLGASPAAKTSGPGLSSLTFITSRSRAILASAFDMRASPRLGPSSQAGDVQRTAVVPTSHTSTAASNASQITTARSASPSSFAALALSNSTVRELELRLQRSPLSSPHQRIARFSHEQSSSQHPNSSMTQSHAQPSPKSQLTTSYSDIPGKSESAGVRHTDAASIVRIPRYSAPAGKNVSRQLITDGADTAIDRQRTAAPSTPDLTQQLQQMQELGTTHTSVSSSLPSNQTTHIQRQRPSSAHRPIQLNSMSPPSKVAPAAATTSTTASSTAWKTRVPHILAEPRRGGIVTEHSLISRGSPVSEPPSLLTHSTFSGSNTARSTTATATTSTTATQRVLLQTGNQPNSARFTTSENTLRPSMTPYAARSRQVLNDAVSPAYLSQRVSGARQSGYAEGLVPASPFSHIRPFPSLSPLPHGSITTATQPKSLYAGVNLRSHSPPGPTSARTTLVLQNPSMGSSTNRAQVVVNTGSQHATNGDRAAHKPNDATSVEADGDLSPVLAPVTANETGSGPAGFDAFEASFSLDDIETQSTPAHNVHAPQGRVATAAVRVMQDIPASATAVSTAPHATTATHASSNSLPVVATPAGASQTNGSVSVSNTLQHPSTHVSELGAAIRGISGNGGGQAMVPSTGKPYSTRSRVFASGGADEDSDAGLGSRRKYASGSDNSGDMTLLKKVRASPVSPVACELSKYARENLGEDEDDGTRLLDPVPAVQI